MTKLLFVHSNKFDTKDGKYYSNGIFINDNLERYTSVFDELTVFARKKKVNDTSKLVEIDNPRAIFKCIDNIKDILKKNVRSELEETVKQTDYVIVRAPSLMGLLVVRYAKKYKKPYLMEVVGNCFGSLWYHSFLGKLLAPFEHIANKIEIKKCPYVLYVTKEYLEKVYPTKGLHINCSNVELKKNELSVLNKRLRKIKKRKKDDVIVLATIASVEIRYKGQQYVIKALYKLKQEGYKFNYKIVGNGNNTRLNKLINKYNLEDTVDLVGGIPHERVFELLDNVDVYIQPSIAAEGLPRAMIEAMSRGCLCTGTNICGIPELIDSNYLFKKGRVSDIKKILKNITVDKMEQQAKINYNNSKEYEIELLKTRRKNFFEAFRDNK